MIFVCVAHVSRGLLLFLYIFFCVFFRSYGGLAYVYLKAISVKGKFRFYFAVTGVFVFSYCAFSIICNMFFVQL